ncbi:hypothetical protein Tco_0585378 [Tanacetum coccineum]
MEDTLSKFMSESAKRHEENSNLIKGIRVSIKTLEIQIRQIRKVLQERRFESLPSSTEANLRDQVKSISTTIVADSYPIRRIRSSQYAVSAGQKRYKTKQTTILFLSRLNGYYCEENKGSHGLQFSKAYSEASHINKSIPRKEKDPGSFTLSFFINNVCFNNALVDVNYIELNDLNEPFELRRNQGNDLLPTIEEGEVIEEFRTRDDKLDNEIDDYPSYCDYDKKIHIDFHNSIMKDKMVYKGNNVIGALMNVPNFVGTFSVVMDFAVLEDMDAYRDEGMGDVIFGKPFLREVGIKTRRFKGTITIYNGNDEVTYQIMRPHPRFKHHTNEQCNKIPPLLKLSNDDKRNGISHPYQKLKGFYKGVLNLGPDYIRDARTEEWLTRGHISVHEME